MKKRKIACMMLMTGFLLTACQDATRLEPVEEGGPGLAQLADEEKQELPTQETGLPLITEGAEEPLPEESLTPTFIPTALPTPTPVLRDMPEQIRGELGPALILAHYNHNITEEQRLLEEIRSLDASWGQTMEEILAYWDRVNQPGYCNIFTGTEDGRDDVLERGMDSTAFLDVPLFAERLPEDDSLCFIVAGFELENNGSPKKEMIDRLVLAIACLQEYPNAYVMLTGGPTALGNPSATEGGVMAAWLVEHGVEQERIIVEDKSMITYENASFAYGILQRDYPQIRELVLVTSDYHIPLCGILYEAQCLMGSEESDAPHLRANIGCVTSGYGFTIGEQYTQLVYLIEGREWN